VIPVSQSSKPPRRICILSGGGDAPGVNAIVRGFLHAARQFSMDVFASRYGFEGLVTPEGIEPVTLAEVRGILPRGGCVLGCSTRINPFFMADGPSSNLGPAIVARLRAIGIDALVLIGGDGTTLAAERFGELGMGTIAIPKTIDNDLGGTQLTCGFDSAVLAASHAVDALHATAEAHRRVMVLEVMGRSAGFIALSAGLAGGADVVLIPELPYRLERILSKVREREALGLRFSIVVIAEGARPVGGPTLEVEAGSPGHLARLGGAGTRLVRELDGANLGHEVRLTVLGHLQRGGSPSAFDRILGTELGTYAAELCAQKRYGRRIVVRDGKLDSVPLSHGEARLHKQVDLAGPLVRAARLVGIELGDATEDSCDHRFYGIVSAQL
jgi:ATP-dependent phosphofructokinase / diphosphate-dependent phosphofructokinase